MIIKEKEFKSNQSYLQKLGDDAEKQMAFYLRRNFGESDKYFVFNDLKITHNGETCQIDHLVLTTTGFFIIESKSCVGEISYDENGQWIRHTGKRDYGMQSPLTQTDLQIKILKKFLQSEADKDETILGKLIGTSISQGFGARTYTKIIAIADNTIIKHPNTTNKNVMKSDSVCNFIENQNKGILSTIFSDDIGFSKKQVNNIVNLLTKTLNTEPKNIQQEVNNKILHNEEQREIDNKDKKIEYGRYGYYFKYPDGKNESINEKCKHCGNKMKIRKEKSKFFLKCLSCEFEELFWENSY